MALLNFRYSFLDAQNKAEFFKAGKSLVSEFRNLQMKEKMDNQNDTDRIILGISKNRIAFFWTLNNESRILVLNKEGNNFTKEAKIEYFKEVFQNNKLTDKITIYDTVIIKTLVKKIGDIYTGENWGDIYQE